MFWIFWGRVNRRYQYGFSKMVKKGEEKDYIEDRNNDKKIVINCLSHVKVFLESGLMWEL